MPLRIFFYYYFWTIEFGENTFQICKPNIFTLPQKKKSGIQHRRVSKDDFSHPSNVGKRYCWPVFFEFLFT